MVREKGKGQVEADFGRGRRHFSEPVSGARCNQEAFFSLNPQLMIDWGLFEDCSASAALAKIGFLELGVHLYSCCSTCINTMPVVSREMERSQQTVDSQLAGWFWFRSNIALLALQLRVGPRLSKSPSYGEFTLKLKASRLTTLALKTSLS